MPPSTKRKSEGIVNSSSDLTVGSCESGFEYSGEYPNDITGQVMTMPQLPNEELSKTPFPTIPDKNYPFMSDGVAFRDFNMTDESVMHLSVPPRKSYDHVKDKELRKKLKNRESAQAARDRKKAKMMFLERQVSDLIDRNRYLEAENMELRKRIQMGESDPFWRLKPHSECSPNVNPPQYPHPEASTDMPFSNSQEHILPPQPHQTSCAFASYSNDVPGSIMNGPCMGFDKSQMASNTDLNGNTLISRGDPTKCEGYTPEDKAFNHQVQQYLMQDGTGESLMHPDGRFPENCYSQIPKLECVSGNYPSAPGSESSSDSSRKNSSTTGDHGMNAEDWLMLSFKPDIQSSMKDSDQTSSRPDIEHNSNHRPFIQMQSTGHQYPCWDDMPISLLPGDQCHRTEPSKGLGQGLHVSDMNNQARVGYNYHDNSYCDSSGVESMSSPDMSVGSAVSSPDGSGGLRHDFSGEKHAFKVH